MKRSGAPPLPPRSVVSSSPSRPEKLPTAPGLARLLRGKSGGRSRGPRSSPMFRSRSVGPGRADAAAAAGGDPSSPKVSCIGQVRIRTKKKITGVGKFSKPKPQQNKPKPKSQYQTILPPMRCRCFTKSIFCKIFPHRRTSTSDCRWWWCRKKKSYRQPEVSEEKPENVKLGFPMMAARSSISSDFGDGDESEESRSSRGEEAETSVFMQSASTTPPKNALLLMRCRSAPHNRSSALANSRFAVMVPVLIKSEEEEDKCNEDSPRGEPRKDSTEEIEEDAKQEVFVPKLTVLMRCKSEPARTAAAKLAVVVDENVGLFCNSGSRRLAPAVAPPPSPPEI